MFRPEDAGGAVKDAADLINALTALAWPLIVGVVVWRLFPIIKKIVRTRGFTVKVAGAELSVQALSEQLVRTTSQIQSKLASISTTGPAGAAGWEELPARTLRRVLWVDDHPADNAYVTAQLQALGVEVVQATSTREAVAAVAAAVPPFDAVLSDLDRTQDDGPHPDTGLELARELRARGEDVPLFVYTSPAAAARRPEILAAGVTGLATTSTALFELLRGIGSFPRTND
ncbi:response regulator [Streptomyces sp. NPDC006326]|uniref:response regulator n=1 Tax=Streptomyces sp. NPDC006326 TaxID=3156752 RepID=UPI0033B49DF6